jgi:uncharacterized phosphosugar-binding protein
MIRRDALKLLAGSAGIPLFPAFAADDPMTEALYGHTVPWDGDRPLALVYHDAVRDRLIRIRNTEAADLLEAGYALARRHIGGATIWHHWDTGHSTSFDIRPGRNGAPMLFTPGFDPDAVRDGDCLLAGHRCAHQVLAEKDVFVVGAPSPWSRDAGHPELITHETAMGRVRQYSDIWIETGITTVGALMKVPGMTAPIGPISGIYGLTTFWMMIADCCRELARLDHPAEIDGDGPALAVDAARESLERPLGPVWFDTFLRQYELLGAEYGSIERIARMAADTVLAGGHVWCWSRDSDSLAYESTTRRGGLAITRGVFRDEDGEFQGIRRAFEPREGDLAIIGTYAPDDPVDLDALDRFKAWGMKTASIGPMTRGGRIPEGRTVAAETDVHVGRVSDTYGLFALPGFGRRACPTSGATMLHSFWLISLAICEEMINRTGDVPGVFLSGAITGGMDHLNRTYEMYDRRGY